MKRTLAIALAIASVSATAFAQQALIRTVEPGVKAPANEPVPQSGKAAEERSYEWFGKILQRRGTVDTNRSDLTVPLQFNGGTEMRGFGQIFPAPRYLYPLYTPSVFNENGTSIFEHVDSTFQTDQEYIDQFKNAGKYNVSFLRVPLYRNPRNNPQNPGLLVVYKVTTNFAGNSYKTGGFSAARTTLKKVKEFEINSDGLDSTVIYQGNDTLVSFTRIILDGDPGSETAPMEFAANESMLLVYVNEFAPAVVQGTPDYQDKEWQRVISYEEYRTGSISEDPDNPGNYIDTRANPLDSFRCLGVVLFRQNNVDQIVSAWKALRFIAKDSTERSALVNLDIAMAGTLELVGGVQYHYGSTADNAGIGSIAPNPVRERTTIPFALVNGAQVKIDLFNSAGDHVKSLVDNRYVAGKYSVDLTTDGLANGVYLVRMITGDQVYTSKITVSK